MFILTARAEFAKFVSSREKYINMLVNNAGVGGVKNRSVNLPLGTSPEEFSTALLECTQKTWDDVMHINTSSVYFTTGSSTSKTQPCHLLLRRM